MLDEVFALPAYQAWAKEPLLFWAPLLALHMGICASEVPRIAVDDVVEQDGVTCIIFLREPIAHAEPTPVRRRAHPVKRWEIPVPQALLDIGFLDHLAAMRAKGEKELFCRLGKKPTEQAGAWITARFRQHLRSVGVETGGFPELRYVYWNRLGDTGASRDRLTELLRKEDRYDQMFKQIYPRSYRRDQLKILMDKSSAGTFELSGLARR